MEGEGRGQSPPDISSNSSSSKHPETKPSGQHKRDNSSSYPLERDRIRHKSLGVFGMPSLGSGCGVYRREDDMEWIIEKILSDDCRGRHVSFLRVVGSSGLGKTTLLSLVYRDNTKLSEYFDAKGWVFLSAERCNQMGLLLRAIIECFVGVSCGGLTDLDQLREILEEELAGKRFLLVLDDACNEDPNFWSDLLPTLSIGAKGSVVVVTAQTERVADFEGLRHSYQLNTLDDDICWWIIKSNTFGRYGNVDPNLARIGKKIAANCRGVPLLAVVISRTLCYASNRVRSEKGWDSVLQSDLWNTGEQEVKMFPALRVGYEHLSLSQKQPFMYCSLFPKNYIFEKDYVIRLWISQGFIDAREWKKASVYFDKLLSKLFFQHSPLHDTQEGKFVMHELLRDLARSVAGHAFFRAEDYKLSYDIPKDVHHLSFSPTEYDPVVHFEPFKHLTGLNSLLVINSSPLRSVDSLFYVDNLASLDDIFSKSRCLRTLDLSYTNIKELPDSIEYLESLRYLGLNNTSIRKLPDSIGRLSNLQILELRNCCYLSELPIGIKDLVNLLGLDVWKEYGVIHTPLGIGCLTNLQTLGTFNVGELCKLSELSNLGSLRGHLRIGCLENVIQGIDAVSAFLEKKEYLQKLTLQWNSRGEELEGSESVATAGEVLENLRPNKYLLELIIRDYCGLKFPTWLSDSYLGTLASVTLVNCYGCYELPNLGQLPSLRHLFVQNVNGVRHVVSDLGGETTVSKKFPALRTLKLWEMYDLEDWYDVKEMDFPYLRSLSISRCPRLRSLPSFKSLVELSVHSCGQFRFPAFLYLRTLKIECLQNQSLALPSTLCFAETLEIQYCNKLSSLDGLQNQHWLKKLKLRNCSQLSFPQDVKLPDALQVIYIHFSCSSLKNWCPYGFEDLSVAHNQVSRKLVRAETQIQDISEDQVSA